MRPVLGTNWARGKPLFELALDRMRPLACKFMALGVVECCQGALSVCEPRWTPLSSGDIAELCWCTKHECQRQPNLTSCLLWLQASIATPADVKTWRGQAAPQTLKLRVRFVLLLRVRPDQPIASMFFVTTSSVLASSAVGLNSMTSVPAKISGK